MNHSGPAQKAVPIQRPPRIACASRGSPSSVRRSPSGLLGHRFGSRTRGRGTVGRCGSVERPTKDVTYLYLQQRASLILGAKGITASNKKLLVTSAHCDTVSYVTFSLLWRSTMEPVCKPNRLNDFNWFNRHAVLSFGRRAAACSESETLPLRDARRYIYIYICVFLSCFYFDFRLHLFQPRTIQEVFHFFLEIQSVV